MPAPVTGHLRCGAVPATPDAAPRASRRFVLGLLAITLVALGIRVAVTLAVDPDVPKVGDATAYHLLANNLADGRGYIRPFDLLLLDKVRPTAEYPPLLPALVSIPSWLGADTVTGQRLFLCLIGAASVAVIGLLGRRVAGPAVGLVAAGLAAAYPILFLSDATLTPETLFALLVAGALLAAYRALDDPSPLRFAALGALVGLATLTRAEGALLALLLVVPAAVARRAGSWRRTATLAGTGVLVVAAIVVPWTARNYARFDELVPVSNNLGTALDGANCSGTYRGAYVGFWLYRDDCFEGFDQAALERTDEAAVARHHRNEGLDYASDHAGRLPAVMATRWLRTFALYAPRQQTQLESFEGRPLWWQRAGTLMYAVLVPFAVAGLVLLRRRRAVVWPLLVMLVSVSVTALVTYGNQRFRTAFEPALLVRAAAGVVAAARWAVPAWRVPAAQPVEDAAGTSYSRSPS